MSSAAFNLALAEFARDVGIGADKQVLLVVDRAGWHLSPQVTVPHGLHLAWLPAYSPELQPAERLWPLSNEPLVNQHFATLDALLAVQAERCRTLRAQPKVIKAHTHYHWWPSDG